MTLTCYICNAVIKRNMKVIMVDPYRERIKHAIKKECRQAKLIEEEQKNH